ncbi:hypothetical protein M422DRAFT_150573, partial [Sphaerobolus stellatus SS14]
HDAAMYENPEKFVPERFMDTTKTLDPSAYIFGFGRRVCPGLQFGMDSVHLHCIFIMAAYHITYKKDDQGRDIPAELKLSGEMVSR